MSETIPDDVMKAAYDAVTVYVDLDYGDCLNAIVARAILAERERVEKIAEKRIQHSIDNLAYGDDAYWQGSASSAEIILAAIRTPSTGEEQ